jgi:hypothetical protein
MRKSFEKIFDGETNDMARTKKKDKKNEREEYWKEKIEKKQKPKRRPPEMTKAEWEEEKGRKKMTKIRSRLDALREKAEKNKN